MLVPAPRGPYRIRPGEAAELVVLSNTPALSRLRAVCEAFLPAQRLWLAHTACVERTIFEEVSAELADARRRWQRRRYAVAATAYALEDTDGQRETRHLLEASSTESPDSSSFDGGSFDASGGSGYGGEDGAGFYGDAAVLGDDGSGAESAARGSLWAPDAADTNFPSDTHLDFF
eukprot:SM001964S05307  [mRNA]  locus=s1964:891:1859:- [translate_table: standard]